MKMQFRRSTPLGSVLLLLSGSVGSIRAFSVDSRQVRSVSSSPSLRSMTMTMMMTADANSEAISSNVALPSSSSAALGRRQALFRTAALSAAAMGWGLASLPGAAMAATDGDVGTCPRGSQNCIRTTWTPPAGTTPAQASQVVKQVLEGYPQEGYDGVDLGGWKLVDDQFNAVGKVSRIEVTSGIGNFAKFLNGGRPFIDDVWIQVDPESGIVEVRSSSRVGDSDLGVNKKRLTYFYKTLSEKGWNVPEPTY
jgi:Protein of unknown function (DUF1499)